ncbi:MAG: tRNA adenosine deaminase-associated protein [Propionibacteriaceae bacterium]|nr:tRNA adenosine deaminase-associated protein [Propionibacteriaceae bacterium]
MVYEFDEIELPALEDDRPGLTDVDHDDHDDDSDFDFPSDASEEDIDLLIALYREDGQQIGIEINNALANDLDALISQLRRIPGDAGALGMVSLAGEVFVLVRVRGKNVKVYLSDLVAALDWPICRDVVEFLDEELPEDDDESMPVGDADILADAGLKEFDLETIASSYEIEAPELLAQIANKIQFGPAFRAAVSRR